VAASKESKFPFSLPLGFLLSSIPPLNLAATKSKYKTSRGAFLINFGSVLKTPVVVGPKLAQYALSFLMTSRQGRALLVTILFSLSTLSPKVTLNLTSPPTDRDRRARSAADFISLR